MHIRLSETVIWSACYSFRRIPRLSGIGRHSRAPATRRANEARPPVGPYQIQQQATVLGEGNSGEAAIAATSCRGITSSTTQRSPGTGESSAADDGASGSTPDGVSRPRHRDNVDAGASTKRDWDVLSSRGGSAVADGRFAVVEDGVTQLTALEDVNIPTDSEEDEELNEVQVNQSAQFFDEPSFPSYGH